MLYILVFSFFFFFFSSRRRHTRFKCDWSSDVCSSDLDERLAYYNVYFSSFGGEALISGDIASVRDVKRIDPSKVTQLIKPDEKITYHEMMDRAFKFYFGETKGLDYIS